MAASSAGANWHKDPMGRHEFRYWDGAAWTEHVADGGVRSIDPLAASSPSGETATQLEATPRPAPTVEAVATAPAVAVHEPPSHKSIPLFGARKAAEKLQEENAMLEQVVDEHGLRDIVELEAEKAALTESLAAVRAQVDAENAKVVVAQGEREAAARDVVDLRDATSMQEFGLFDYEHPAENSVKLSGDLEALRVQIKQAVTQGNGTTATANFTFNNSTAKGAKFVKDMSKLMLRSYNAEAENCVKTVKAGNLAPAQKRLSLAVDQIQRLGTMINLQITPYYHRLRLAELELAARHMQALQAEKEAERAQREELREQRKAEQELRAERDRLDKERQHYANALAVLEANGDAEGAERMREQIADADRAIADVDYRAANVRAGYVYVISNVGSFGPEVVKIGMTRRLVPQERVDELGDASVPFRFDVHALFFSADAVTLETGLHQHFADRRLNRVNLRREYFRATPAEVLEALRERHVEVLEYAVEPAAEEYRASIVAAGVAS